MISFLNPALLPWLLAAAIPLAIHLLTRRTRRKMDLPTLRFLQRSLARQSNLFRVRHILLLLLRTIAVTALVLAFLKPTVNSALGTSGVEHAAVVLVIDCSASMGYTEGGTSSFSRARNEALKVLEQLQPGDSANVIFCGALPQPVLAQPGDDLAGLERAVRDAQVTEQRAEPTAALNIAEEQLTRSKEKTKRLYLFSDFQRSNWANVKFDGIAANTKVVFVAAAPDNPQNAGITAIHIYPPNPRVGEPITADCDVFNSSGNGKQIAVSLTLSNGTRASQSVKLAPFSSATASFALLFDSPAQVECSFSIPADNLTADDTRLAVIDLRRMPVIVLITDDNADKAPSGAFFLKHAMHPDNSGQSGFQVTAVRPSDLNNPVLHTADAVVVCNAAHVPDVQYQALAKYLTDGGSIVWFLCGADIASQMASLAKQLPPTEPMPMTIDRVQDLTGNGKGYVTLTEAHYESPLLKVFKDPAAADLGKIQFRKICITGEVDPRAETLLKYEDGTAAAVRSGEGSGNLLLVNMSPSPDWSDLAKQEAFVPLLHEFLKGIVAHDSGARDFFVGGAASATIAAGPDARWSKITCTGPNGPVPVTADPVTGSVVIERTRQSGFYHLASESHPAASFAVNVSPDETDLRAIDPRELETAALRRNSFLTGAAGADADVGNLNKGKPLWHYLLLLMLICLCAEMAVNRMTARLRT